jgi:RNA polymerase sigma factor (sigma-70 family)
MIFKSIFNMYATFIAFYVSFLYVSKMDDSTLIRECLRGRMRAQKLLFDKFSSKMMGVCLRYCHSKEQAEDALQEGFIKVFLKLSDYKFEGSFEGWIRRIMIHASLDILRKEKDFSFSRIDDVVLKEFVSDVVLSQMSVNEILIIMQNMPDGYRVVFNMFAIEGFSHHEIATFLGISENTSKSQFARAKSYLKQRLNNEYIERAREH